MSRVKLSNICKEYKGKRVLENVSFTFEGGKIYGVIGKNGAGKTTMMKILSGVIEQSKGLLEMGDHVVGALIESPSAYQNMTAKDNLKLYIANFEKPSANKIDLLLNKINLVNDNKKFKEYSIGMKKRLGIALALSNEPTFLILDEPTSGLDINGINEIREIVRSYMKDKNHIVLISSHDTRDLVELCDVILFMEQGKIIDELDTFEKDSIVLEMLYMSAVNRGTSC